MVYRFLIRKRIQIAPKQPQEEFAEVKEEIQKGIERGKIGEIVWHAA